MAKIIEAKCPRCGAPLSVQPGVDTATCQYCGTAAVIDHGPGRTRVPTGATEFQGMPVVRVGGAPNASAGRIVAAVAGVLLFAVGMPIFFALLPSSSSSSVSGGGGILSPSYYFSDKPMLADVNGDGAIDVVGKSNVPAGKEWIAAYDGRDGKELWRTAEITKDAAEWDAVRAVVGDKVVSVDSLGKVQAYALRTGTPAWSALLGEKVKRICLGDGGLVAITTADDARQGLEIATGKKHEIGKDAPCKAVPTSHGDVSIGYRIVDWPDFAALGLPELNDLDVISAHRALVPDGAGPRFMLGSRPKGTQVAMVAAVDKKKVVWKDVVPGVDPLTTTVNVTTQLAAYVAGYLVIPYDMKDHDQGTRMACFDGNNGRRLWDIQVHQKTQVAAGIAVSNEDVFFASWTALYVISLKTGKLRYVVGKEF
jgi:outer membrane protein assembly factor BamB